MKELEIKKSELFSLLKNPELGRLFREFLHQTFCSENLSYFLEVEEFSKDISSYSEMKTRALAIWDKFLSEKSDAPINVDDEHMKALSIKINLLKESEDGDSEEKCKELCLIFEETQEFVITLLVESSLPRFKKSPIFLEYQKKQAKESNDALRGMRNWVLITVGPKLKSLHAVSSDTAINEQEKNSQSSQTSNSTRFRTFSLIPRPRSPKKHRPTPISAIPQENRGTLLLLDRYSKCSDAEYKIRVYFGDATVFRIFDIKRFTSCQMLAELILNTLQVPPLIEHFNFIESKPCKGGNKETVLSMKENIFQLKKNWEKDGFKIDDERTHNKFYITFSFTKQAYSHLSNSLLRNNSKVKILTPDSKPKCGRISRQPTTFSRDELSISPPTKISNSRRSMDPNNFQRKKMTSSGDLSLLYREAQNDLSECNKELKSNENNESDGGGSVSNKPSIPLDILEEALLEIKTKLKNLSQPLEPKIIESLDDLSDPNWLLSLIASTSTSTNYIPRNRRRSNSLTGV